jgi:hypothetical protein
MKGKKVMKGGNFYGFKGALDGTGAGADWNSVENLAATPAGNLLPNNGSELLAAPLAGGRRRRAGKKTRKGGRKGRRMTRRRRTMRGGANFHSITGVGAGYAGRGAGGLADFEGYSTKGPVPGGHAQGPDGVMQL